MSLKCHQEGSKIQLPANATSVHHEVNCCSTTWNPKSFLQGNQRLFFHLNLSNLRTFKWNWVQQSTSTLHRWNSELSSEHLCQGGLIIIIIIICTITMIMSDNAIVILIPSMMILVTGVLQRRRWQRLEVTLLHLTWQIGKHRCVKNFDSSQGYCKLR